MHKFVFLDTNVFEHFPPLEDIDWARLASADSVTLVIPQVTIRELNRHKDTSQRPRQKRRAADSLRKLSTLANAASSGAIRPAVDLVFRPHDALIDFSAFHLRRDVPDDELLASAIEFATEKRLDQGSVLVSTADLGLQLKGSSQLSIGVLPMPESMRLPDEPDSEERRVKELEERLQRLSGSLPKLHLAFLDGGNFEERTVSRTIFPVDDEEIARSVRALRAEHPYLADHPCPPPGWTFSTASKTDREEYNKELQRYFLRHERFLRAYIEARNWQSRTRSLCLVLENKGSVPADEIDVCLRFPQGVEIIAESDFKSIPELPAPPDPPNQDRADHWPDPSEVLDSPEATSKAPNAVIAGIRRSSGGAEVEILVSRLKHTFKEHLPVVNLHFPSIDACNSFQFTYKLVANNFPQAVEGKLDIKITVID